MVNRATVLVLLGGLTLTALFIIAPKPATEGRVYTPRSDAEVLERVKP